MAQVAGLLSDAPRRRGRRVAAALLAAVAVLAGADRASAAAPPGFKLRAIGDSVTSAFGYCGHDDPGCGGTQDQLMGLKNVPYCIFGALLENRCSSNHLNTAGVGSTVAWAKQFALREGVTDYQNFAVQGSTPADWDVGVLRHQLDAVVAANPNLTVMTLGANPILRALATHLSLGCIVFSNDDNVRKCLREQLAANHTEGHLENIYAKLLQAPRNHVVVFFYMNVVPAPAASFDLRHRVQLAVQLINEAVHRAVLRTQARFPGRITVLHPDHSPWPLQHQCAVTQAIAIIEWQLRGRTGELDPRSSATPLVLDADLCTHPSIAGHEQFANALVRWFDTQPRSRATSTDPARVKAALPLIEVSYQAVQIRRGFPVLHIRLRQAATLRIRIRRDPCEQALIDTGRCPRAVAQRPATMAPTISRVTKAGTITIRLPVGDGLYESTIIATARDGTRQVEPVEVVCETLPRLVAMSQGRR